MDLNGIKLISGFALKSKQPLDARAVAASKNDIINNLTDIAYDGMIVYAANEKEYYKYNPDEGWKPFIQLKKINDESLFGEGNIEISSTVTQDDINAVYTELQKKLNANLYPEATRQFVNNIVTNSQNVDNPASKFLNAQGEYVAVQAPITIDNSLSSTSQNPVQNKVIYSALSKKVDKSSNSNELEFLNGLGQYTPLPLKTINSKSLIGTGNIEIKGGDITVKDKWSTTNVYPVTGALILRTFGNLTSGAGASSLKQSIPPEINTVATDFAHYCAAYIYNVYGGGTPDPNPPLAGIRDVMDTWDVDTICERLASDTPYKEIFQFEDYSAAKRFVYGQVYDVMKANGNEIGLIVNGDTLTIPPNTVLGSLSTVLGFGNTVESIGGLAIGSNNILGQKEAPLDAMCSFVGGIRSKAKGACSFAFGNEIEASKAGSIAFGSKNIFSSGDYSGSNKDAARTLTKNLKSAYNGSHMSDGQKAKLPEEIKTANTNEQLDTIKITYDGNYGSTSLTFGRSINFGSNSLVGGYSVWNGGANATTLGNQNLNLGANSLMVGLLNNAVGVNSITAGDYNANHNTSAIVSGTNCINNGARSIIVGYYNRSDNHATAVFGDHTKTGRRSQLVAGEYNVGKTDTLFEIGNGDETTRSNAFEVFKDGSVKIYKTPQNNEDAVRLMDLVSIQTGNSLQLSAIFDCLSTSSITFNSMAFSSSVMIDWGDGTVNRALSHDYASAKEYRIKIYNTDYISQLFAIQAV